MTGPNNNRKAVDEHIRFIVGVYEDMLMSGHAFYFDEDDLLDVADYYYNDMSRNADAIKSLDYALRIHPDCVMAKLMKAEIYFFDGQRQEAWDLVNGIMDKDDPDVMYYCGLFKLDEGKVKEANEYYKRAYFAQIGEGLEMFCQIVMDYIERNITKGLDRWFAMLPDKFQEDPQILEVKAEYYHKLGKYREAVAVEEKLIDRDPYNSDYWRSLAKLYYLDGNLRKAYESVVYALDINPDDSESILISAEIASNQSDYARACESYAKYIQIDDKNGLAYFDYAQALACEERYAEALVQLKYAEKYRVEPGISMQEINEQRTVLYWALDDLKNARLYLEKARKEGLPDDVYMLRQLAIELKDKKSNKVPDLVGTLLLDYYVRQQENPMPLMVLLVTMERFDLLNEVISAVNAAIPSYKDICSPFIARMALCEKDRDKFLSYLRVSVRKVPYVTRQVFHGLFPVALDVKDYYDYAVKNM